MVSDRKGTQMGQLLAPIARGSAAGEERDRHRSPRDHSRTRSARRSLPTPLPDEFAENGAPLFAPSIVRILEGTLEALESRGARKLSMSDICEASGVSRGTLYRYFSTKEDVLAAVSEYVSLNFVYGVRNAARKQSDPVEVLRAVMQFCAEFTVERAPDRIFEVGPGFHFEFLRTHFSVHKVAIRDALEPVFDALEKRLGHEVDRDHLAEAVLRLQLSTVLVPASADWMKIWLGAPDVALRWIGNFAGLAPSSEER